MLNNKGFTLIELMVALTIVGITASYAIPNLTFFLHNQALIAAAKDIQAGPQRAKALAVSRNEIMYVLYTNKSWTIRDSKNAVVESSADTSPAHVVLSFIPNPSNRISYNSFGMITTNVDASNTPTEMNIVSNAGKATTSYKIQINGGAIRLCEPNRPINDARRCI